MRPRIPQLRAKYRAAVARLVEQGARITLQAVAGELDVKFNTARNFLYRNPRLAKELGLSTREHVRPLEYLEAAKELDRRGEKVDGYAIAKHVGRSPSAVYRFLRNHQGIRARMYEATGALVGKGEAPVAVVPRSDIRHLQPRP